MISYRAYSIKLGTFVCLNFIPVVGNAAFKTEPHNAKTCLRKFSNG